MEKQLSKSVQPNQNGDPAFAVLNQEQFSFCVNRKLLACIYRDIANVEAPPEQRVNIHALVQNGDFSIIVPGQAFFCPDICDDFLAAFNAVTQTPFDLERTEAVLNKYCVDFERKTILYVSAVSSIPGIVARIQAVLNAVGVKIFHSYISEGSFLLYDVSNNQVAKDALELTDAQQLELIAGTLKCKKVKKENCKKRCEKKHHKKRRCSCKSK